MLTVNTNSTALIAQNNLGNTQKAMENSMLKLSTGLRINSAADDAAGLQISNRMSTQISGLDVAMRNANDAISMAQTAEGAMEETSSIMNRMRDLALQSANDTNTQEDRDAMQAEVDSLMSEVDRIATTTNFSGQKLLNGEAKDMTFQIGSNANETISFSVGAMDSNSLSADLGGVTSTFALAITATEEADGSDPEVPAHITEAQTITFSKDGKEATVDLAAGDELDVAAEKLNTALSKFGVTAQVADDGETIGIFSEGKDGAEALAGLTAKTVIGTTAAANVAIGAPGAFASDVKSLATVDLSDSAGAQQAIKILDQTLAGVDKERANLGAVQNRLDSTISNLSNIQENMTVSQSRILDVDFAKETTSMTKSQMLMQAGSSVLAQAKSLPQYAVQLMG